MATTTRHLEISEQLLRQASDELDAGDLIQSSEKAWGAVVHYVKSVAVERGWAHDTHRDIFTNVGRIIGNRDADDPRRRLLKSVRALHVNYYEDEMDAPTIRGGIRDARELDRGFEERGRLPVVAGQFVGVVCA